jgi:hypothetical protein
MRILKITFLFLICALSSNFLSAQQDLSLTSPSITPNPLFFPGTGSYDFTINNVNGSYAPGCATIVIEMNNLEATAGAGSVSSSAGSSSWSWELVGDDLVGTQIGAVGFLYSEVITVDLTVTGESEEPGTNGFTATVTIDPACGDGNETNNIASSFTWTVPAPSVPVDLISFTAEKFNTKSRLNWSTASELNNSHFDIERSTDGRNFSYIGQIEGKGNSSLMNNYEFVDQRPENKLNYYRLKQVDFDGRTDYSDVKTVNFDSALSLEIFPNPVVDFIRVSSQEENIVVNIFDVEGKLSFSKKSISGEDINTSNLASGVYLLEVSTVDGTVLGSEKIIVSK